MGEDPEQVIVEPNKEFGDMELSGQSMVEMATARNLGFPISARTLHELASARRLTKRTYEEEVAEAKLEEGEEFPFKRSETGDRAAEQPNAQKDEPEGGQQD